MSQRSPYNDRNKVDQKGKTRKSASSAKPKRAVADLTPADSPKKPKAKQKSSAWGRAKAAWKSDSTTVAAAIEGAPRMKQLRRTWWMLWGGALAIAVGILVLQQLKFNNPAIMAVAWALWLAAMGGAFYIEFVPIRKEREALLAASKAGGKPKKNETALPGLDDRQPPTSKDSE
jgi:uncharacterized membrane protein